MSRITKYLGVTALVLIVTALGVGAVFAQTATPPATANTPQMHGGFGRGGICGQAGLDAAAKALKMTTEELTGAVVGRPDAVRVSPTRPASRSPMCRAPCRPRASKRRSTPSTRP